MVSCPIVSVNMVDKVFYIFHMIRYVNPKPPKSARGESQKADMDRGLIRVMI